jgi:flagellin
MVATDAQKLIVTTTDSNGNQVSANVDLSGVTSKDSAIAAINTALQTAGGNLAKLVAVDEDADSLATGKIRILGNQNFGVYVGTDITTTAGVGTPDTLGVNNGATTPATDKSVTSASLGSAGAMDISTTAGAQQAVNALAGAVASLGSAQAAVGKGENNFNYAMNLAQSQSTNLAAAESRIRDADLAAEAANLTKAQILVQAGTAALAQANSAPQAILSLLK